MRPLPIKTALAGIAVLAIVIAAMRYSNNRKADALKASALPADKK